LDPTPDREESASLEHALKPRRPRSNGLDYFLDAYLLEGRKTQRFAETPKRRRRLRSKKMLVVLLIAITIGVNVSPVGRSFWGGVSEAYRCSHIQAPAPSSTRAVALIDQLASEYPDPSFVQSVRSETVNSGLRFDYVGPNGATVDYFANLPSYNYGLIILRIHGSVVGAPIIATSEKYKQDAYISQQIWDRIGAVNINGTLYFALEAPFVADEMCGRFPGTMILFMGCDGQDPVFGNAFVQRGARVLVGWEKTVTVTHTDIAFEKLVSQLLNGNTIMSSVRNVMKTVGPDPQTGSSLSYYPSEAATSRL
jgi:hypothetical protein